MTTRKDGACFPTPEGPSRRDFLRTTAFAAGALGLQGLSMFSNPASAALRPASSPGRFALELDGQFVEFLKSVDGGFAKADVINQTLPQSPFANKRIGPPKYLDIAIQCGPMMPRPLFDWINATLTGRPVRKNGAIITGTFDLKEQSRLQFSNALISEITFPACDGAAKEPAYITVKISPEFTQPLKGSGAVMKGDIAKAQQKLWLPANFGLTIDGLDCSGVAKIDAFTIKQHASQDSIGDRRDYQKEAGKLEIPNLAIYLSESRAGTFYEWFQDMVIKGNAGDDKERRGTLMLLDPTRRTVLLTLTFEHLGIFGFSPDRAEANADQLRRVKAEMYCEQITLSQLTKVG